jgi:microcystin degradation protein MlrC
MTTLFLACLATETNTFAPIPTVARNFEETYLARGGRHHAQLNLFAAPLVLWRQRAEALGWRVVESLCTFAQPSGTTTRAAYETFRDEILADLKAAMPVDVVMLSLHGAMVADGYDDCEGDLVRRIRAMVGPKVPIGVELDLHCHIGRRFVEDITALVIFKEYPHTDFRERAEELFAIIADTVAGKVKPAISVHDCRMIGVYHTTREPMAGFVRRMKSLEGEEGVLSVSLGHCFPWADVKEQGTRVVIVTDGRPDRGAAVARALGEELWAIRDKIVPIYAGLDEAVARAAKATKGPLVLADMADNPGGGAAGDSTFIPRALMEKGVEGVAVGCLWDPIAVAIAMAAGEGATVDLRIGGKVGPGSGDPLDVRATVTRIVPDCYMDYMAGSKRPMGDTVAVRAAGVDFILHSTRGQTVSPTAFSKLGVDPLSKKVLVVKSMQHFHAAFAPVASEIIYVAAPGTLAWDFRTLPYAKVARPVWPLDPDPFSGKAERPW